MKLSQCLVLTILLNGWIANGLAQDSPEQDPRELLDTAYDVKAYKPDDPERVTVKVSLSHQALYVIGKDRVLMAAACTVGRSRTPTPVGNFKISKKEKKKRRLIEPDGGYPMGFWCEFQEGYGIHAGWVHPQPRTNGTIRLHHNVAPKFFRLVRVGTPVIIADSHPEDESAGKELARPMDSHYPELPPEILYTDAVFSLYKGPLFVGDDQTAVDDGGDAGNEDGQDEQENEGTDSPEATGTPPAVDDSDGPPFGIAVRGKANLIESPYARDRGYIDVTDLPSGTTIRCPWSGKVIRVP